MKLAFILHVTLGPPLPCETLLLAKVPLGMACGVGVGQLLPHPCSALPCPLISCLLLLLCKRPAAGIASSHSLGLKTTGEFLSR